MPGGKTVSAIRAGNDGPPKTQPGLLLDRVHRHFDEGKWLGRKVVEEK